MEDNPHIGSSLLDFQLSEGILKRNKWTTEEVIKILKGQLLTDNEGNSDNLPEDIQNMNRGIEQCIEEFEGFTLPVDQYGAIAYCPENNVVYHIGPEPKDDLPKQTELDVDELLDELGD